MGVIGGYIAESAALAIVFLIALSFVDWAIGGLWRALGLSVGWSRFLAVYFTILVLNVVGTEVYGAEFLLLYKLAALTAGVAVLVGVGAAIIKLRAQAKRSNSLRE